MITRPFGKRLVERHAVDFGERLELGRDVLIMRRPHLSAVGPEDLDCVVRGRIVAGGDHDAAIALVVANRDSQLRRAANPVVKIDAEARGDHDLGRELGELARTMPAVVGDRATQRRGVVRDFDDVVGQRLDGFANSALVDRVAANRVHPPATSGRTKGNGFPKGPLEFAPTLLEHMLGNLQSELLVSGIG